MEDKQNSCGLLRTSELYADWKLYALLYLNPYFLIKVTKFCEIFLLLLTVCTVVKSKGNISQNFVAFSEYMNFRKKTGVLGFKPNNPTDWKLHELNLMIPYFLLSYNLLIFDMNQKAIKI